jgi:hypothetical protein
MYQIHSREIFGNNENKIKQLKYTKDIWFFRYIISSSLTYPCNKISEER